MDLNIQNSPISAAAPMSASEEILMSPIAGIRKNEALIGVECVERISVKRPSSSEESKESEKEVIKVISIN